ncbi:ZIP-like iron-zinc transporter [Pterulicium gracile]|uniref:ZIP-like iron-zinc transporter n=1 Tax=Pterulicium gracile TaxID=1884261 RepID=A0A5C3QNS0_9AGAR|nr:ZIP-like iron-zinc transporter [Pterula gracilis]
MASLTDDPNCGMGNVVDTHLSLRVASIFVIGFFSTAGTLFPVLARSSNRLKVPDSVFQFSKYFGSGVIIATAFIHLLAPAIEAFESTCLSASWHSYPWALGLCLLSIFAIFVSELLAFRWGNAKLAQMGEMHDPRKNGHASPQCGYGATGTSAPIKPPTDPECASDSSCASREATEVRGGSAAAKIVGIAILEFGVLLHSILVGMTLAVDKEFKVLFVVLLFHQTFEGLGLGARLAYLDLPRQYAHMAIMAALVFGLSTSLGIAAGLGVKTTYNPGSATASIVSGVMDSISAGILIYTGLVELLAHEFLFNEEMMNASNGKLVFAVSSMFLGCALMALLGKWA